MKINEVVAQMRPPRYTTAQAAALVGRTEDTLSYWRRQEIFTPSERRKFGKTEVWLYTQQDIEQMRQIAKVIKPGRKPMSQAS